MRNTQTQECRQSEEEKESHLPCAGIILIRFYGYYLSLSSMESAPRELGKTGYPVVSSAKIQEHWVF